MQMFQFITMPTWWIENIFELYQFVVSLLDLLISAIFLVSILVHWNLDKLNVSSWD